jgi:hypothetical protein
MAGIRAWFITSEPPEFRAVGRIMVQPFSSRSEDETPGLIPSTSALLAFYGTQIEILESRHLMNRAAARMLGLHPEMEPCEVQVRVTQTAGSSILNVLTAGPERKFTRGFLEAMLDEFVAYHKELQQTTIDADSAKLIAEMSDRDKRLKESKVKFDEAFRSSQDSDLLAAERMRLAELVSKLRGEFESLKHSSNLTDQIVVRLKDAETSLQDVIGKAAAASEHTLALEPLKLAYQNALGEQEEAKAKLQSLAQKGKFERVIILERPADAIRFRPDLVLPIVISAMLGLAGGLLLMLFISLVAAILSRPAVQPPPLS